LEKIHGTSASLSFKHKTKTVDNTFVSDGIEIKYFSGGTKYDTFVKIFNESDLVTKFITMGLPIDKELKIFGESYGGKEQGMSHTYGTVGKFVAFDVRINDSWLNVPTAENIVNNFGLEFVHYVKVSTDLKELDAQRDAPSVQAIRNGITTKAEDGTLINPKKREGVIIRPLIELIKNNGNRVICKHKGDDFKETATPRPVVDPSKMKVLAESKAIADEWVTVNRLKHVLQRIPTHDMEKMKDIIATMLEDVLRESSGEIVDSPTTRKAISTKTAITYKDYLKSQIGK